MQEERKILEDYIVKNGLRNTHQRYNVLEVFLNEEGHFSIDELHDLVKKKYPEVSYSTTFRTMKVVEQAGLATKIRDTDGVFRFEHLYKHEHHGHLVCIKCGAITEYDNSEIVKLQQKIAKKYKFEPKMFGTKVSGICASCAKATNKNKQSVK